MRHRRALLVTLGLGLAPAGAGAQCAIDLIASGVTAYRELALERAQELLHDALEAQRSAAPTCAAEGARALAYLGASHWLLERPDSALHAFEQAVIQAPRFEPDPFEFPPDITEAFDRVRRATPSVAVIVPEEATLDLARDETLAVRVVASALHALTLTLRGSDGERVRTLYEGDIESGAAGIGTEWDGRDSAGRPVAAGRYELEVVSADSVWRPVRKVVVPLTVDSDAPVAPPVTAAEAALTGAVSRPPRGGAGVWSGLVAAGVGLAAGALVVAVPPAINGFPESEARWVVGASLGLAGIVGLIQRIQRVPARPAPSVAPVEPLERAPAEPELSVRVGSARRVELASAGGVN